MNALVFVDKMKNEKNYAGFHIPKIWQILKRFSRALSWAQTSYFWRVIVLLVKMFYPKKNSLALHTYFFNCDTFACKKMQIRICKLFMIIDMLQVRKRGCMVVCLKILLICMYLGKAVSKLMAMHYSCKLLGLSRVPQLLLTYARLGRLSVPLHQPPCQ